jgi:hypothetical protein
MIGSAAVYFFADCAEFKKSHVRDQFAAECGTEIVLESSWRAKEA